MPTKSDIVRIDMNVIKKFVQQIISIQSDKSILNPNHEIFNIIVDHLKHGKISHLDLLDMIGTDHNLFSSAVIKMLIDDGFLSYTDLLNVGIDRRFIEMLANDIDNTNILHANPLTKINKQSTEIYFWGIPSSGKTCALGALLSVADNGRFAMSLHKDIDCRDYGYMHYLSCLFSNDNYSRLPQNNINFITHIMDFNIELYKNKLQSIRLIDIASETITSLYKSLVTKLNEIELECLINLKELLIENQSLNRKIHIFVIEYDSYDYKSINQREYLDNTLNYITRSQIFETETNAIYLLLTKIDKAPVPYENMDTFVTEYIKQNYTNFHQRLENICKQFNINKGKIECLPFSVGEVCFQDFCHFNDKYTEKLLSKLLNHINKQNTEEFKYNFFEKIRKYILKSNA